MSNISAASPPTKSDNHDGINVLIGDDNSNNNSSSDEYETDSQAEELETDTDETDEGEEEQWSLRVRLLSAVDLPPSLSPTVPLCPWFKFGLVEDINTALDEIDIEKQRKKQLEVIAIQQNNDELLDIERKSSQDADKEIGVNREIEKRKKRLLRPKRGEESDDEESDDVEEESDDGESSIDEDANPQEQQQTLKVRPQSSPTPSTTPDSQLPTQQNMNTTSRLLQSIPSSNIRTSTSKIMSRNINGGGGNGSDWDEEYRWNELVSPMESCLLIRLNTRLAPDNGGLTVNGSSRDVDNRGLNGPSMSGEDTKSEGEFNNNNNNLETDEEVGALSSGIRGLWRKGRQQLEEVASQRRLSMAAQAGVNGREERAAAVAQFIMRKGSGEQQSAAQGGASTATGGGEGGGLNQQDLVEYQQRWNEVKEQGSDPGYEYNAPVSTTVQQSRNSATNNTSEGLCLGTLTIPLSRLPLEDAFKEDGKAAVIEKWYQLDDPNNHKRDSMLSDDDNDTMGEGMDDEEPTAVLDYLSD